MHARLAVARNELPRALRIALAAGLAWWIARLLGADRPVFAALVPMIAIRDEPYAALSLSLGRMLGVMAGVLLGIAAIALVGVSTAAVALLLVAGLAAGLVLRTGPELNTQIAISALLLVVATQDADDYALERIWETGVGAATALAVAAFVLPPDPLRESRRRLDEAVSALADDLAAVHGTLTGGDPSARALLAHAGDHARAVARAVEDIPKAQHALRLSPLRRGSRPQLDAVDRRTRLTLRLAIQVRRLARDLASFAHREDLEPEWTAAAERLPPIADAVAAAAAKALAGEGCSREVAEARTLLAAYQGDDTRPVAAILRRPLVLLCDEALGAAGVTSPIPAGEEAEVAALTALARRLGVPPEVRMLSAWAALPPLPPGGDPLLSGSADLLLRFSPVPVLGVTGTAGKSTTARLAESMLRGSGIETLAATDAPASNAWPTAALVTDVLRARPPAWCVAELTSNHLAVCNASPRIACVTSVWPDHVDQHGSLAAYLEAKRRIVAFQGAGDWTVVNADDPGALAVAAGSAARVLPCTLQGPPADPGAGVEDGRLVARLDGARSELGPAAALPTAPGAASGLLAGASALLAGATPAAIAAALRDWRGLPLRRERLGVVGGSPVVRDALAATPAKAAAGLALHAPGSVVLIAGGYDDLGGGAMHATPEERELLARAAVVAARACAHAALYGPAAPRLAAALTGAGLASVTVHGELAEACADAVAHAAPGREIVFAPWFATTPAERAALPGLLSLEPLDRTPS